MGSLCRVRNEIIYVPSLEYYFGVYLLYYKHQINPLVSTETVHHSSIYIILYTFNPKCWRVSTFMILHSTRVCHEYTNSTQDKRHVIISMFSHVQFYVVLQ